MNWHLFENFKTLRFGQGAVSKNLWAYLGLLGLLGVAIFVVHTEVIVYVALGVGVLGYLSFHIANYLTMKSHPMFALMEGMELAQVYRGSQGVMGRPDVALTPGIENPADEPPRRLSAEGEAAT